MIQHSLSVTKPFHKKYKWFFEHDSADLKMNVLESGILAHQAATHYTSIEQESVLQQQQQQAQTQIDSLQEQLDYTQKQQKQLIMLDRKQQQSIHQSNLDHLQQKLKESDSTIQQRLDDERQHLDSIYQTQVKQIDSLYQTQIKQLHDKINQLQSILDQNQNNNKFKGSIGEDTVLDYLHKTYPDSQIDKVANTKHGGDIKMITPSSLGEKTVIFEIRNYQNSVSAERRQTLERDVHEQDADAGILVSLHSGIVGRKHMELEFTKRHKPLIYLSNAIESLNDIQGALSMIYSYTSIPNPVIQDSERQQIIDLIQQQSTHIQELNKQIQSLQLSKKKLLQTHQNLSNLVQPQHSDTDSLTVSQLKELLKSRQLPTTGKRIDLLTRWTNFTQTLE